MPDVPARSRPLDRAALERVLARAAELQGASSGEPHDGLSEAQILELGKEVGIAPEALRQAIAEERAGVAVTPEHGLAVSIYGTGRVTASRTIRGAPADVLATLDAWMQRREALVVKRRTGERMSWEASGDFMSQLRRGFNVGGRGYHLARAAEVSATVASVDGARSVVRLDADYGPLRDATFRRSIAVTGVGAASTAGLVAMNFAIGIAALPVVAVGAGAWYLGRSAHVRTVARGQLALEQVLDRLEDGGAAPGGVTSLLRTLASSIERELLR